VLKERREERGGRIDEIEALLFVFERIR